MKKLVFDSNYFSAACRSLLPVLRVLVRKAGVTLLLLGECGANACEGGGGGGGGN